MTSPFARIFINDTMATGPGSTVGIATDYGLDGPGIESRWGDEIFRNCPDRPWGPLSLLYNEYWVFPGGKERSGRDADPSPPSRAMVKKECRYTSTPPMGCTACTEPQCRYKGAFYTAYKHTIKITVIKNRKELNEFT